MSDARQRAEEALAEARKTLARALDDASGPSYRVVSLMVDEIRALLAEAGATPDVAEEVSAVRHRIDNGRRCRDCGEAIGITAYAYDLIDKFAQAPAPPAASDEVYRERDLLRERLDQFEAYGFPNVATVLDRLEALRASRSIDLDETQRPARSPASDEVREAAEMLRLTVGMREAKHACNDRTCSNVALGALNLLAALSRPAPCPACGRTGKGCACTIEERDAALSRPAAKGGSDDAR